MGIKICIKKRLSRHATKEQNNREGITKWWLKTKRKRVFHVKLLY